MSKCLVLIVEGETEEQFYKRIIANAKEKRPNKRFDTFIEHLNVRGVGGFKNIALRKFIKKVKETPIKAVVQIGVDCLFLPRRQTAVIVVLCRGFVDAGRTSKTRQDGRVN